MKISTIVSERELPTIRANGGYISEDHSVVVPIEGRLVLLKSEDGSILIDGEGYRCKSQKEAQEVLRSRAHKRFRWDRTNYFHTLPVTGQAAPEALELARKHGFEVFKGRLYRDGYLVLRALKPADQYWPYRAGKVQNGSLYLVGKKAEARIPEEAVGLRYMATTYGNRPGDEHALVKARA